MDYDVIVVGAGAAGLMAAGGAAREGLRVLLAEQGSRPARKVLITGKGRCNLTNNCSPDAFLAKVRHNPRFLYSAVNAFPPAAAMDFFEGLGVPLKTERGNRVFPVSDRSADIAGALERHAAEGGAVLRRLTAKELLLERGGVRGVDTDQGPFLSSRVILATGGMSYPRTGSDGRGYRLARQAGHRVTPLRPSLIGLDCAEDWCGSLAGLSLRNVTLTLTRNGAKKPLYRELGEMLFTHTGVSGPLVLTASSYMEGIDGHGLTVDLKPGLDEQKLDARLLRDFEAKANRDLKNALDELLPKSLIPVIIGLAGIDGERKVHQVTREQRQALGRLIKNLPMTPTAFGPLAEAIVTAGGVEVGEINPRTMESKLLPGLFFAGEMLDVDGTTGGYNLHIAFATGRLAAWGAAGRSKKHE